MRRVAAPSAFVTASIVALTLAHAEGGATPSRVREADGAHPSAGLAVLATRGAELAGWALAKEVYADAGLRPASIDESAARVLVGYTPSGALQPAVRDLADERAIVHGEDGASRAMLAAIALQLRVGALLVVGPGAGGAPSARVFLTESQSFDAARYAPDAEAPAQATDTADAGVKRESEPQFRWSATVRSIVRTGVASGNLHAPSLATSPVAPGKTRTESPPFYTSPWFWAAAGAAAFGATAVWFATRDNTASTIHFDLQVQK